MQMTINPTITDIRAAADLIAGVVVRTPTVPASWLDQRHGTRTFLKLEIQ
jgi:threonine dehydratase